MTTSERPKNIVLCSDGTGQSGTKARGTNVWKIRMAVDRHDHDYDAALVKRRQIVFYDAGVGTSALSVKKTLGNAFGYGLAANMRELYTSLANTYDEGDFIYIFGFSRGAFTARSLAGMISEVGVIDGRRDSEDLDKLVRRAYRAYRASKRNKPIEKFHKACQNFKNHKKEKEKVRIYQPRVHFVGVWDTVDAYGMPIDELNLMIYKWFLWKIRRPHNDQLTEKMDHVFHAMAIDEDRKSFAPTLYDERNNGRGKERRAPVKPPLLPPTNANVDQVWFAGAHSNVGGGYPRQGLSDEALEWMMTKAEQHGLRFTVGARKEVQRERDGNSLIYDQRSGPGVIWRYKPRDVAKLCKKAGVEPRIHVSALDRIELSTAGYGPITLPNDFEVVGCGQTEEQRRLYPNEERQIARFSKIVQDSAPVRKAERAKSKKLIRRRTSLYYIFLLVLAVIGFFAVRFHVNEVAAERYKNFSVIRKIGVAIWERVPLVKGPAETVWGWVQGGVEMAVPTEVLNDFVAETFEHRPEFIVAILLVGIILFLWHKRLIAKIRHHGLRLWQNAFYGAAVDRDAPAPVPPAQEGAQ